MIVKYLYSSDNDILNEDRYYMGNSNLNFNRTSGAKDGRLKGALKSIPSFLPHLLLLPVTWPVTLLSLVGAIAYRQQKRWEDRDAKRQIFNPAYWVDYVANPHEGNKKDKDDKNNKDNKSTDSNNTNTNNTTTAVAAGAGAVTGGLLADKLKQMKERSPEERKTAEYKPFWVTFSNGEIVRLRSYDEKGAKEMANAIIEYNKEPVYGTLNKKIKHGGFPRYKFYLDTGEIVYWSAKDKKEATKEAFETRKELCEILNRDYQDLTKMEPMDGPKRVVKSEAKNGEEIPLPEKDKFVISRNKPDFSKQEKTGRPFWKWGTLNHFKTSFAVFTKIAFPAENEKDAEKIVREFYDSARHVRSKIQPMLETQTKLFKINFADGDIYHMPGKTQQEAVDFGKAFHEIKYNVIEKHMIGVNKEDYEELIDNYNRTSRGTNIKSIAKISDTPETYSVKNPKHVKLVRVDSSTESVEWPTFDLW